MLVKIVTLVYHVNAIHWANCDIISCQFMINEMSEFETPACLYE